MERNKFIINIKKAFEHNGYGDLLNEAQTEQFHLLFNALVEANKSFNLTAITEPYEVILKHFLDCATVIKHIPQNAKIIDVGCGAGFPSLPIAILRDDVHITALDSTAKKTAFIAQTAQDLGLTNVQVIAGRAEDAAKQSRESFDIAVSRAVARMNILDELCIPFVKIEGKFIAMKSSRGEDEYAEAASGIELLGCAFEKCEKIRLTHNEQSIERENYIFVKRKATPSIYPRNYGKITKKPL